VEHLPAEIREQTVAGSPLSDLDRRYASEGDAAAERAAIRAALESADGHRERAARMLGMSRTTLWRKMKEHGLEP
jgi:transcriptional regulator of acetoin/glycerol metabolism